jgi:DNA-binding Lrp family transcriptional regulator
MQLCRFPEVEEMHSVAGDASVIFKVRTESPRALEAFLSQVHAVPGVTATKSYVALSTYLERPVQANMTADWPENPLPA